jgi:hypothetical protein
VTITAYENGQARQKTFHMLVTNVAPATLTIDAGSAAIGEWDMTTVTGSFTDPGAAEVCTDPFDQLTNTLRFPKWQTVYENKN